MFLRPILVGKGQVLNRYLVLACTIITAAAIYLFDYHRYKNRDEEIIDKYKNSKANKWFKLWMLFILIWLLFLLPFLVSAFIK